MYFSRINKSSVTEALALAMENAGRMKTVIVIYETLDSEENNGGMILQEDVTLSQMNWLLDLAKKWVLE
jgi:hypothetical protein